ncbi:hypothetical protein MnTg01_00501 [archaeon MnTg01]|nr:hypothetical protein MnTg01_00501 [archaeon MnTg01]
MLQPSSFIVNVPIGSMGHDTSNSEKPVMSVEALLVETIEQVHSEIDEKTIPDKHILEFISRHHLGHLWEEFLYEKEHPKIPLSAGEVLAMINMSPEEQEKILKAHEEY